VAELQSISQIVHKKDALTSQKVYRNDLL